jgi:trimethylamine--corrinoid protein Co-methyltransferase
MISPRSFDKRGLDIAYNLLDKGIPMYVATMPVAGISAPINMISTLLQSMFESFAGLTMLNLINDKSFAYIPPDDVFEADPFDMKYSTFVYGSVEFIRAQVFKGQLCKYYDIPFVSKSMNAGGKKSDEQSASEVSAATLITAMLGARVFRTGGCISACEISSAEQLVIDYEIMEYVKNLIKNEDFNEERLMIDEIKAVGPGASYVSRMSTIKNFRREYWEPELFTHSNLGQWLEFGSKSINQYANEIAKKRIASFDYQVNEDIKKELDSIYECAKNDQKLIDSYRIF